MNLKFNDSGVMKRMDETYTIIGYNEKKRKVTLEKKVRYGIYYDEIRVTNITRNLDGENNIRLIGLKFNLKHIQGL